MKKTKAISDVAEAAGELREEYRFDYAKAKPNQTALRTCLTNPA